MWLAFRYLSILVLAARCVLSAQPAAEPIDGPPDDPTPPAIEEQKAEVPVVEQVEPADPVEPQVKKRRRARQQLHGPGHGNAIIGEHVVVNAGESVRELVLIGGSADIQGTVERELVVIGGTVKISGSVEGEVVLVGSSLECSGELHRHTHAILSKVELTDTARLEQGGFFLGGPFKISPKATILGERIFMPFGDVFSKVEGLKAWLIKGLLWGRLLPLGVQWVWVVAGFFVGLYFLTLILFPAAIKAIFLALEERPVTSVLSGFLTLILFAPLTAILIIAVVGIPVVPFLQVALVLALLFGKAAVMCFLGRSFGRSAGAAVLQVPLAAFFIGATILILAYMIPFFGVFAWVVATVFGLGGAVVAIARTFKREEGSVPPAPVILGPKQAPVGMASGIVAPGTMAGRGPGPANPSAAIASSSIAASGIAASGLTAAAPAFSAGAPAVPPVASAPQIGPGDTLLLPRVGFWKRLLATLLDFILLGLLVPVLEKWFIVVAVLYFVAMWTWKGTTVGSLLLRLRVVRTDGSPVTFSVALVRSLASIFSILVLFLGFLWTAWDREKQSWHDKIAGTVVVQMPKGFALV